MKLFRLITVVAASVWATSLLEPKFVYAQTVTTCNEPIACLFYQNNTAGGLAIEGQSTVGTAVGGSSTKDSVAGVGVAGTSTYFAGVEGIGGTDGVLGLTLGTTIPTPLVTAGVEGVGGANLGVYGVSTSSHGVYGASGSANGVWGTSTTANGVYAIIPSTGYAAIYGDTNGSGTTWAGYFNGRVSAISYATSSDARLKTDVLNLEGGLRDLVKLRPVTYKWKADGNSGITQIGFIAQEIRKVYPNVVQSDAKTGMLSVNYQELIPVVVEAVQEQQQVIQRQEARIEALEQGRPPLASSISSLGSMEAGLMIGLLPVGFVAALRRRRKSS